MMLNLFTTPVNNYFQLSSKYFLAPKLAPPLAILIYVRYSPLFHNISTLYLYDSTYVEKTIENPRQPLPYTFLPPATPIQPRAS